MHEHRRHWPWPVVLLAGALIGAAEPFGIIGEAWIADPTVDEPIVTPTDWWPPDSSFLGLLAVLGVPLGAVLGVLVAATLFALARVVDDALGVLPAAVVCGVLAAGVCRVPRPAPRRRGAAAAGDDAPRPHRRRSRRLPPDRGGAGDPPPTVAND